MAKAKKQVNEAELIEAYFTTKSEHRNDFFFKVYKEAKNEGIFESTLTPLKEIDRLIDACYIGRLKPIQTAKGIVKGIELFNYEQQCFIYDHLIKFLETTVWTGGDGKEIKLEQIKVLLDNEFLCLENPNAKEQPPEETRFDFEAVKQHLKTFSETKEKIKYLIEIKTEYQQSKDPFVIEAYNEVSFDNLCDLEINKLETLFKQEKPALVNKETESLKASFTLSKAFSKIDYIRVINALSELRMFQKDNGTYPTKKEIMQAFGTLVNIDLSKYDTDLSQAFNNTALEANLKIFEDMKDVTQDSHHINK